jgi:hypothetical protein
MPRIGIGAPTKVRVRGFPKFRDIWFRGETVQPTKIGQVGETVFVDEETTDDPDIADVRNFYKVELRRRDRFIERMLYAGTSLARARAIFAEYTRRRPAARLMIRQRERVLDRWPRAGSSI